MVGFFQHFNPITQAFLATLFTWGMTALGASLVFATKTVNQRLLDSMLGFAGGVMIAASYWSLLAPAIEMSDNHHHRNLVSSGNWIFTWWHFFRRNR